MALKPDVRNAAQRFIDSREPKHRRQIVRKIVELCLDPEPADSQALHGAAKGERRATAGEYRIIYSVAQSPDPATPGTLSVTAIGKRNDAQVYRRRK